MRCVAWFILASLVSLPAYGQGSDTAFTDVRVFDGDQVLSNVTVLLHAGRITAVGKQVPVPRGAKVIAGSGKTLLPGLIDAHVHTFSTSRADALRFGVTTELDMFTDVRGLAAFAHDRESLDNGTVADVYSAGTLVTVANGHGTELNLVIPTLERAEDADAFVADRLAEGSDFIKLVMEDGTIIGRTVPTLPDESVSAVIRAAKARGKLAVVHVSTERDALFALRAGADGLVHMFQDVPASDEFIQLARERRAFVIPTLSVIDQIGAGSGPTLLQDARLRPWLTVEQRQSLANPYPLRSNSERCSVHAKQSVRRLRAAGVALLAGTDAGNPGTAHGASLYGELEQLVAAGLTPRETLLAATSVPARRFVLSDRGRIAPGMRADVVLVRGDPTKDIAAVRDIVGIWKNGMPVDRSVVLPKAAPAPPQILISDFDGGVPAASYGNGWEVTTDEVIGGTSGARLNVVGDGAQGTRGSLEIRGEVKAGAVFPWAGVLLALGSREEPLDYSNKQELVFWAKGDRAGRVMMYSGELSLPAIVPFAATTEWAEYRLPLQSFSGAVLERVRAICFVAGNPPGKFRLKIDQVGIR